MMRFIKNGKETLSTVTFIILCIFSNSSYSSDSDSDSCPVFDDYFLSDGKSDSSFSEYLKNPILERNVFGLRDVYSRDNVVHLKVFESPLQMVVTVYSNDGKIKTEKTFDSNISCEDKKFIFSSSVKGSGDGSSVQYSEMKTELFWQSKSILSVTDSRYSESRSWIFFRNKNKSIVNYTFPKVSKRGNSSDGK